MAVVNRGLARKALLLQRLTQTPLHRGSRACMSNLPAPWNYLWKPGPYPKTEAERVAAAKKYGMLPEDYKPFPNEGEGLGDYPDLGRCSGAERPGNMWWDDEDLKTNAGQPLHYNLFWTREPFIDDTITEKRSPNQTPELRFLVSMAILSFCVSLVYLTWDWRIYAPVSEPQDPYAYENKDKKFYTFEKPE